MLIANGKLIAFLNRITVFTLYRDFLKVQRYFSSNRFWPNKTELLHSCKIESSSSSTYHHGTLSVAQIIKLTDIRSLHLSNTIKKGLIWKRLKARFAISSSDGVMPECRVDPPVYSRTFSIHFKLVNENIPSPYLMCQRNAPKIKQLSNDVEWLSSVYLNPSCASKMRDVSKR